MSIGNTTIMKFQNTHTKFNLFLKLKRQEIRKQSNALRIFNKQVIANLSKRIPGITSEPVNCIGRHYNNLLSFKCLNCLLNVMFSGRANHPQLIFNAHIAVFQTQSHFIRQPHSHSPTMTQYWHM